MRILVADDHALIRIGLIDALGQLCDLQLEFIEAEDADQVAGVLSSGIHLDLILLDLFMPGAEGFELLSDLCARLDGVPVVILSASESEADIRKAIDCGASGYVPKSTPASLMLQALRLILAGGVYFPAELIRHPQDSAGLPQPLPRTLPESVATTRDSAAAVANDELIDTEQRAADITLTARQLEVLALVAKGRSNKKIARELGLSEFTVKAHLAAILRALGVSNRIEASVVARSRGLVP
ncbi:response regulator transcription factor [Lamprobacter modestohalophilus]|uniref:response regulator transcription factor n=1 Tax=Lamprobacter modestohalophilus TaxID=1064514 RepID=UPI002ADECBA5|nr:response regulator transcription factor [Lamprobacter modestohalophilus]MEA1049431.1 response regulator transcription factor [Lamprobacter modestohalophilus]